MHNLSNISTLNQTRTQNKEFENDEFTILLRKFKMCPQKFEFKFDKEKIQYNHRNEKIKAKLKEIEKKKKDKEYQDKINVLLILSNLENLILITDLNNKPILPPISEHEFNKYDIDIEVVYKLQNNISYKQGIIQSIEHKNYQELEYCKYSIIDAEKNINKLYRAPEGDILTVDEWESRRKEYREQSIDTETTLDDGIYYERMGAYIDN